jgi:hypothetical protein
MGYEDLKKLVESKAKAIQALASTVAYEKKERQKMDRAIAKMAETVSLIGAAQSNFWEIQADYYRRLKEMDERKGRILEIIEHLSAKDS